MADAVTYELTCTYDPASGVYVAVNTAFVSAGDQTDGDSSNNTASELTTDGILFTDDFESGTTSAWSSVLGGS